jgi:hypothetical protein
MHTLAATTAPDAATHGDSLAGLITVAVIALVLVTAGYLLKCWLFPFTTCHHGALTAARCRRCQGTSRKVRAGRRLLNELRTVRNTGRRHR